MPTVLVDQVDQHDGVGHDDADQHQHTHQAGQAQRGAGQPQRQDGPGGRERDGHQQDQRLDQGLEQPHQHHVDQQDGRDHGESQLPERLVDVGGHTADFPGDALGQVEGLHRRGDLVADGADVVAAGRCGGDGDGLHGIDGGDGGNDVDALHVCDRREGEPAQVKVLQILDGVHRPPCLEVHIEVRPVDRDGANGEVCGVGGDEPDGLGGGDAQCCCVRTAHGDLEAGGRGLEVGADAADALEPGQCLDDLLVGGRTGLVVECCDAHVDGVGTEQAPRIEDLEFSAGRVVRLVRGQSIGDVSRQCLLVRLDVGGERVADLVARAATAESEAAAADGGLDALDAVDVSQHLFGLLGLGDGLLQHRAGRQGLGGLDAVHARFAEQVDLQQREHGDAATEDGRGQHHRHHSVGQRPCETGSVEACQPPRGASERLLVIGHLGGRVHRAGLLRLVGLAAHEPVGQHGHDGQRDQE